VVFVLFQQMLVTLVLLGPLKLIQVFQPEAILANFIFVLVQVSRAEVVSSQLQLVQVCLVMVVI